MEKFWIIILDIMLRPPMSLHMMCYCWEEMFYTEHIIKSLKYFALRSFKKFI